MTTITITISVDAGPDARVSVAPSVTSVAQGNGHEAAYVPPFEDELIPLPDEAISLASDRPAVFRGAATAVMAREMCPVHHVPWKLVPAGVSKKNGRAYDAFQACPERGCDQRPA